MIVAPLATAVVNTSIRGVFPDDLKEALVKPLLKKANLDVLDKNYCPVLNLPFIGKLIERVVVDQLSAYIQTNEPMEPLQPVYRLDHSTETALLKMKADINKTLDNKEVVCLVLLDLSAAFDTVSHKILLYRLEKRFGITDTSLKWVESYLHQCIQRVVVEDPNMDGARSNSVTLTFGVPQGSILGPILLPFTPCLWGTSAGNMALSITFLLMTNRSMSPSNKPKPVQRRTV